MKTLLLTLISAAVVFAQAGHWEGSLKLPDREVPLIVDLDKAAGGWIGSMSSGPMTGLPLGDIKATATDVSFTISGAPGSPTFTGKLAADGQSLSGEATMGGNSVPFSMKRSGDAKVDVPAPSTPLGKELQGSWNGEISAGGQTLHLMLEMSNGANGTGVASVTSIDQGNVKLPVTTVTQKDNHLHFEVKQIVGTYDGDLNAAKTEIAGTWTQGGSPVPLKFVKAVK